MPSLLGKISSHNLRLSPSPLTLHPGPSPNPEHTLTSSPANPAPFSPLPSPVAKVVLHAFDTYDFAHSASALADWLNARWAKSGYRVSAEVVCFTLRAAGRDGRLGVADAGDGAFMRDVKG